MDIPKDFITFEMIKSLAIDSTIVIIVTSAIAKLFFVEKGLIIQRWVAILLSFVLAWLVNTQFQAIADTTALITTIGINTVQIFIGALGGNTAIAAFSEKAGTTSFANATKKKNDKGSFNQRWW